MSENAFQAILKPIFPHSITSILSKVRHSNTLFLIISFPFLCRPLGALVRFPKGDVGGHSNCIASLSQPNGTTKQSPCEGRGGGLKFEKKNAGKTNKSTTKKKNGHRFPCILTSIQVTVYKKNKQQNIV